MPEGLTRRLLRIAIAAAIILALVVFGTMIVGAGYLIDSELRAVSFGLGVCGFLLLGAGVTMLVSAAWIFFTLARSRRAFWLGSTATIVAGATVVLGTLLKAIPCSGPS